MKSEEEPEWQEEVEGFSASATSTELFSATANCLDRIRDELKNGDVGRKPLRAVAFTALDNDGRMILFQCGGVEDVIGLAKVAVMQAMKIADEHEGEGEG